MYHLETHVLCTAVVGDEGEKGQKEDINSTDWADSTDEDLERGPRPLASTCQPYKPFTQACITITPVPVSISSVKSNFLWHNFCLLSKGLLI